MLKPIISADSHVTEPPNTYLDFIEPKFRERAPRLIHDQEKGDVFIIDGMRKPLAIGLAAAAGVEAKDLTTWGARFENLHRGGWDPEARIRDQERDGVAAEVIYPSVGMFLCNHPDFDYKHACFQAYNRWLAGFCSAHPERLIGVAQTAMRSVEEGIEDLYRIKEAGFRAVMMPGNPALSDYHDPIYDPFFKTAVELKLPLSFHILTSSTDTLKPRGPKLNSFMGIVRGNQDLIGVFIFGGVFERHPELKLVCVEADAGWAPHFMYRLDHAYDRHRYWLTGSLLSRPPSAYFRENVYMTFQDDYVAFQVKDLLNVHRLLWANDFPHSDSTWPNSREVIEKHCVNLSEAEKNLVLHDNVAELYGLN